MRLVPALLALSLVLLVAPPPGAAVPPVITPVFTGTMGQSGWWRSNVTVQFQITGDVTSSSGCDVRTLTTDGTHNEVLCTATGPDGAAQSNPSVRIDKTGPTVNAVLERPADHNSWFNQPVKLVLTSLQDATSGPGSCNAPSYGGPDSATASVAGTCTDVAGNSITPSITVKYDDTPPTANAALERAADQNTWFNKPVKLVLTSLQDTTSGPGSCNAPSYTGPDSRSSSTTRHRPRAPPSSVPPTRTAGSTSRSS